MELIFKDYYDYKYIIIFIIKFLIFFIYIFIIFRAKFIKLKKIQKEQKYKYFFCFTSMGKLENKYVKELINYYKKIGVDKFYLADNNDSSYEKLSDLLKNNILDGLLDIIDVRGIKKDQTQLFGEVYEKHKSECKWMSFFDFDEYLSFKQTNISIQNYFSKSNFEKCNVILINWIIYNDNDIVKYDNRSLNERFSNPLYNSESNKFVKSIIKGNLNLNPWIYDQTSHRPKHQLRTCDSNGNRVKTFNDVVIPPIIEKVYLKHFATKTIEEYIEKVKRGHPSQTILLNKWIDNFFKLNKVTKEKIALIENLFNLTFDKYHSVST